MNYAQCTAKITGQHRTQSGRDRCPVHGAGRASSGGWTPRTPTSWPSSRTAAAAPQPAIRRSSAPDPSETVIDLVLEGTDAKDAVRDAVVDLLLGLTPPGQVGTPGGLHALCSLFEAVAVALRGFLDAPSSVIDAAVGEQIDGSRILARAAKLLLKTAARVAMQPATAPLEVIYVQVCGLAIALCPDAQKHRSLNTTCAPDITRKLAAEAWLDARRP